MSNPSQPEQVRTGPEPVARAGSLLKGGRILTLAGVLALAPMVVGFPQVSAPAQVHPVTGSIRQVAFVATPMAALQTGPIGGARAAALTPVQNVAGPVTVVGVTWPKRAAVAADRYQIRTLTGASWSQWQSLDVADDGPDGAEAASAKVGTDPYLITGASKYQVRALATGTAAATGATVQAVDPGTGADSPESSAGLMPGAASAATSRPRIYSRRAWGANERLRLKAPVYGKIALGFVHHTVSGNSYSAGSVPAMIRGIYAYHVRSLGWDDIGYNFLIDRFGRIWEGRYGGVTRAVKGAQTKSYNQYSMGVAAIGNFDAARPSQAMVNAFKRIFAWKFTLSRIPARGVLNSPRPPSWSRAKYFQRISGHRDGFQTTCPGRYLYARLPEIRTGTAILMGARVSAPRRPAAASWAVTRYTHYKGAVLRQGSRGRAVVLLQRALRVKADGRFGPKTRAALVAFERRSRMARNGVANRPVWNRLEKRDYPLIAYRRFTLRPGSRGAVVKVVQRAVRVKADGAFGRITTARVKAVQRAARLRQNGVVSGWTWVAIENRMRR